ncbi:unnamed protein product [Symbiodinium natans]|uniref:Uncharacterized protein n=1 Tax=Symbiodinium natans TaxID=878477 RepID=A0A812TU78_9DINO|nr:unnamed protein product [Symbiodinium natans]
MGCGASTPPASHHRMTLSQHRLPLSQLIPAFDQINMPSRQHADACQDQGAADPDAARYQASAFKDEHEEQGPVVQHASTRSMCRPVEDESGEDDKDPWSSWRSYCWQDSPRNAPLPPDRRLHDQHLRRLDDFRREVEHAPKTFARLVYLHRPHVINVRVLPVERGGQKS